METKFRSMLIKFGLNDPRKVQLLIVVVSLALFAIGAGAPDAGGGIGHQ